MKNDGRAKKNGHIVYGVSRVSPKGQVSIPVDLRNELNIRPGDQLVVTRSADGEGVALLKIAVLDDLLRNTRYHG